MRFAILSLWLALITLTTGCAVTTSERDGLPTGVTLLDSEDGFCDGPIEFDGDPDVVVEEGESTTVAVEDDGDLEWRCLADTSRGEDELDCPDGTAYVRITRNEDDDDFTLECFGS